jgi:putative ABC transport system ATP-binding protein
MLELKAVRKSYKLGETIKALDDVSLSIPAGEFVAVVGPSGCGKSTLLNVLGLLDVPDAGEYLASGQRVDSLSSRERARFRNETVGFIFQSFNLLPRTSAYDNVMLPLKYSRADARASRVRQVLENVGLLDRLQRKPNQLSGGQQQRVAIARALVANPKIILADEPTGNLDTKTGEEIMQLFRQIHRTGTTIVMVTHNTELLSFADRIISMRDGKIISDKKVVKNKKEQHAA